jgi:hypothetical protein
MTLECFDTYNASNLYFADRTVGNGADRQWNWMLCNEVSFSSYQFYTFSYESRGSGSRFNSIYHSFIFVSSESRPSEALCVVDGIANPPGSHSTTGKTELQETNQLWPLASSIPHTGNANAPFSSQPPTATRMPAQPAPTITNTR